MWHGRRRKVAEVKHSAMGKTLRAGRDEPVLQWSFRQAVPLCPAWVESKYDAVARRLLASQSNVRNRDMFLNVKAVTDDVQKGIPNNHQIYHQEYTEQTKTQNETATLPPLMYTYQAPPRSPKGRRHNTPPHPRHTHRPNYGGIRRYRQALRGLTTNAEHYEGAISAIPTGAQQ